MGPSCPFNFFVADRSSSLGPGTRFQCGQSHPFFFLRCAPYLGPEAHPVSTAARRIHAPIHVEREGVERRPVIFSPVRRQVWANVGFTTRCGKALLPVHGASSGWSIFGRSYNLVNLFFHIGRYFLLLGETFSRPERISLYWKRILEEADLLGVKSLGIVALLSVFMGAVITIQTKTNIDSPLIPLYVVGFTARQSTILAGKVGSTIAAEIGSMRVREQIDALDIMGVNSAGYLILPKIIACVLINPFLIIISMFLSIFGGYLAGTLSGLVSSASYLEGIQFDFNAYHVTYALIKTVVFAIVITTISAYHGYYTSGGTREVGISSTKAVVYSDVVILIMNYLLTQMLLL
jgi:phospholipid/cholesterol/gamma-HCH transport system permease protein